ncbi:MAG: carotenoid 1,2-hydratase [Acidibrevibacterium sp.]|uniref:carotenoid 1,2-hydratase n=1 Tax=Acidibrevibacterium sp. TaxID=2606776 RepID=UPI003CFBF249
MIAFIGSVFSPYYAAARRWGAADPLAHCALNVALYGGARKRWAMTERGRHRLSRSADALAIGSSTLSWDETGLTVRINEVTAPWPSRIQGVVRLHCPRIAEESIALDAAGQHRWRPIAPVADAEIALTRPALCWSGPAYLDSNFGAVPLESDFSGWSWSRTTLRGGTVVLYDVIPRIGARAPLARYYARSGDVITLVPPPPVTLTPTRWRLSRATRAEAGAKIQATLEDTPFYARSLVATRLLGQAATAMHETLALDRFRAAWVQAMLPFRMPRWSGAGGRPWLHAS